MQRKNIKVGDIVAVFDHRSGDAIPTCLPVRITRIAPAETKQYGRSSFANSGIDGVVLNEGLTEDVEEPYHYAFSNQPGFTRQDIKANRIYSTWEDYLQSRAEADRLRNERILIARKREALQQEQINHMLSLAPKSAWDKIDVRFEPGINPRLTVRQLTLLLKAARTAALEEATE